MSIVARLRVNPILQNLKAKDNFIATVAVSLRVWEEVHAASWWCELRWLDARRQYRRRVNFDEETANFEFTHADDAMEFLLKFGSAAQNC